MIHVHFTLARPNFTLDAEFHAPSVGVTALFGVSGSGKTTLLRCIAGLERAVGSLSVNGEIWQNEQVFLPTHRRPLGYVFQEASLFPHLSVRARILARDVSLATVQPQGSSISNILPAQIIEIRDEGADKVNVLLRLGKHQKLLARLTRRSRDLLGLHNGMAVFAQVKSVVLTV